MGGYLGGMIAGAVVVGAAGVFLSLTTPLTRSPDVASDVPTTVAVQGDDQSSQVSEPGTDSDLVELAPRAPETGDDQLGETASATAVDTQPADRPEVGDSTGPLDQPAASRDTDVEVAVVAPVAPPSPASLPRSPLDDVDPIVVDSEPAAPVPPQPQPQSEATEPTQDAAPAVAPDSIAEPDARQAETVTAAAPEKDVSVDEPAAAPTQPTAPQTNDPVAGLPRIAALPQIGSAGSEASRGSVRTPVVPLTDRSPEAASEPTSAPALDGPPLDRYAADFANPGNQPLMSIVLIDEEGAFGAEALEDFPYPLTFAVSPKDPQASEKMARYRAAGFEVLAIADLPRTAEAKDAEVALSVWLEDLPETVGVLEGTDTGVQGNRKLADQVAAIAGDSGRGVILQNNGLNTAQKLAVRNGIPAAVVFRDFDGAGQTPDKMRRFLDQAAFRAGQEGAVVMLGRVRPDTISALLLWGLQDRSGRVALAPASAVLKHAVGN